MKRKNKSKQRWQIPWWLVLPFISILGIHAMNSFGEFRWDLMMLLTSPLQGTAAWGYVHFALSLGLLPYAFCLLFLGIAVAKAPSRVMRLGLVIAILGMIALALIPIGAYSALYKLPAEAAYAPGFWHPALVTHMALVDIAYVLQWVAPFIGFITGLILSLKQGERPTIKVQNSSNAITDKLEEKESAPSLSDEELAVLEDQQRLLQS